MIQVVEILGRAEQGMTHPFICRGDDDNTYFVKGIGAGRRSQICEWVAGRLALDLGLPIAPFKIVDVPEELVAVSPDCRELGAGPAFDSLRQTIMELNYAMVPNKIHIIPAKGIDNIIGAYQPAFVELHPLISYSLHRSADFQRLDREARATLQSIEDRANEFTAQMTSYEQDARRVLEEIRNVAAEEGVT